MKYDKEADRIDIVAHSMGFAYAQGMIKTLKDKLYKLGRYYILAPENAGSGTISDGFEEVWQYGSDEKSDKWEQDGVAPQTKVGGLRDNQRVYIPTTEPRGFLESHTIENYKWIFAQPKHSPNDNGYVTPR